MRLFSRTITVILCYLISSQFIIAQTCPSITAMAGTSTNTTICLGQCASLTASVTPVKSTTTYSVTSIPHNPYPYSGGSPAMGNVDDLWSPIINIGFNFCYFGNTFNQLVIGSNGEVTFDLSRANSPENYSINAVLPNTIEHPVNTICVAYRDINPAIGSTSTINTYTTGVAPCRKFVVYWSNIPMFSCTSQLSTFQLVLHEGTNIIETYINSSVACMAWQSGKGLMGIQDGTGTTAIVPPGRNILTPWSANNEAWRYVPTGANTYTVNWTGPSGFTATGLNAAPCPTATSNYTATMNVLNCDGTTTTFSSAIQVSVTPTPTAPIVATPTAVCRGNSSVLSSTGASSYTWMPGGANTSSITVTPSVTTTYTLTKQVGSCTSTQTITLVVRPTPTIVATSNPTVICGGGSATLTANGAATYTWNPGAITSATAVVSPTATTIYTVVGTNTLGCTNSRTLSLTVSPNPTVIASASSSTICPATSTSLTASGANTYTWMPGSLTGANVVVSPTVNTTYTVTGRNTAGCTATRTLAITVLPNMTLTPVASPTMICNGNSSTLTVSGASSYSWMPGSLTGSNVVVSPTVNTTYTVTGTDGNGCSKTATLTVRISTINVTASSNPTVLCTGNSATLTANGAATYTWNPGAITSATAVVSPTATTIYTVVGTNTLGCTNSRTLSLTVSPNPTVIASASSSTICPATSTSLTASGANTYTWMPGSLTGSNVVVSPTVNTTYTVTGRNTAGCTATRTLAISVLPNMTLTPVASPTMICRGNSSTLTVSGASSYSWMPGSLTGSNVVVSPTVNTTYTVTGTDGNGCSKTATLTVRISTINVTASSNPTVLCTGNSATLTANGAATYTWNPGAITSVTAVVSPTATTIYTVVGTNTLGCTNSRTLSLTVSPNPTVIASASSSTICPATSTSLTASGANTYTWMPGSLTGANVVVSPTVNTTYTVTGRNTAGCTATRTLVITVLPNMTLTPVASPTMICNGNSSTLTVSGASSYSWMPGSLTGSNVVVSPTVNTTYTVTGTDGNGCSKTATLTVRISTINVTASSNPTVLCTGNSATLTANGAATYTWNPGAITSATAVVSPTATTIYTVVGTNTLGCTSTTTVNLTVNTTPTVIISPASSSICAGETVTLTANGADNYTWTPGSMSGSIAIVSPTVNTTYTIQGGSLAGCVNTVTTSVTVNPLPVITTSSTPFILCSGNTGTLTANGAATYTWMPGNITGATVTVSPTSTTIFTVTGATAFNCVNTATVNLKVTNTPTISISSSTDSICAGNTSILNATGAVTYTWMPGATTGSTLAATPSITTTYTLTGDNGFGCLDTETFTLTVNPTPTITTTASPTIICSGSSSTLTVMGATNYTWMPSATIGSTTVVTPTINTTYSVTGEDALGCTATETVLVTLANSSITATSSSTAICIGSSATLTASGSSSYTWNPGAITGATAMVTPTISTIYTVSATNTLGCVDSQTISLTVNSLPSLTVSANPTAICAGNPSTLTASGASSYTWNPGAITGSAIAVTPTTSTTYTVVGEDNGCVATNTIMLNIGSTPTISVTASSNTICSGSTASLTATGATSYTWNPGNLNGTTITVTPTITTTYTVNADNGGGCIATETISINVNAAPSITITPNASTICIGDVVSMNASGANTYTWMPLATMTASVTDTPTITTTYTVTGEDAIGCTSNQTITITVNPIPTLTLSVNPSTICVGTTATLTASGATSYSWNPGGFTGNTITDSPSSTTTYTVIGDNVACSTTETITLTVITSPTTLTVTATPTMMCAGATVSLTALGATNYTWMPINTNNANATDNPTVATTYTVLGDNGTCVSSSTVFVDITPGPTGVTAICNGTINCITSTVSLSGNTTSTASVNYSWSGPSSYTSSVQNPTGISLEGTYTLTVTDAGTGCSATETVAVTTNTIPPSITASSPMLGCNTSVTLSVTTPTTSTYSYTWSGPSSFTSAIASPTANVVGDYTVTVTDVVSGCSSTTVVTVGSSTNTPVFTASIVPATCTGTVANNDGTILISGNNISDTYDLSEATTYTGSATYSTANAIPVSGVITNTLNNPTVITAYTLRIFGSNGCFKDTTLYLTPTTCTVSVTASALGITKAVGTPTFVNNTAYNITYTVVAFNNSTSDITNFSLIDSLANTFPSPTSYTVITAPIISSINSSLTVNSAYDGVTNNDLLIPSSSTLTVGKKDTIVFTVQINPNGLFGPFDNTAIGSGVLSGTVVADSSNTGFVWDPDGDGNANNNNIPTTVSLTPNTLLDVVKEATVSGILEDKTLDVTYTIQVGNLGNDTITSVQVIDSLKIPSPATFYVKSGPTTTGNLIPNINYNGISDPALLTPSGSKIAPGITETISFVINITPNAVTSITNTATGAGFGADGGIVNDSSNTVISILPDVNLFIPEVFTPDGDGKNDLFVMKGIEGRTVKITVFNRWGSKVYEHSNYDNTWNGTANVNGLQLGNNKLPQGTYYYIIEFEDGMDKPVNGYVVLQY